METVRALRSVGYLLEAGEENGEPVFATSDLKGFLARNADGGAAEMFLPGVEEAPDHQALLAALDARSGEMGRRALEFFRAAAPEASIWTADEQARFIDQATKRFEAILAVTGHGEEVDEALVDDLREVGASAAWAGSPLPQLLVVLRISRDLVVQTAVEVAEEGGRRWGLALSLVLTRVLPAMDRLTDALAQGYWAAIVGREESNRARYEYLVEQSSDGIYELDITGRLSYANPSLAAIVGHPAQELEGALLDDVFNVVGDASVLDRLYAGDGDADGASPTSTVSFEVMRPDGVRRELHVVTYPRRQHGEVVGYQGVVTDVTAGREIERAKNEFLTLVTQDLRSPIATILGLGVTLEAYADEMPPDRVRRTGASVRRQAERVSRLVDDLYEVSRLESRTLRLNLRATSVEAAVDGALASLADPSVVEVDLDDDLTVLADARRLEQVVANLVENALVHGVAPIVVQGRETGEGIQLSVLDAGPGIPAALVPTLFTRLGGEDAAGLFLVRGLVEAMGGRVSYEARPDGGAAFRVWLMRPPQR